MCKIKIPETYILNDSDDIISIIKSGDLIVKALNFHVFSLIEQNKKWKYGYNTSEKITLYETNMTFNEENKSFQYTLFQKYINKKLDIRVFYIDGEFYPMAIFSQQNTKTQVDFRNYDYSNPNRCVPFSLPVQIKSRLKKLMGFLKLNSGSIDLLMTYNNEFIFLEVNPVGQFDWLSKNCNYFLELKIAKELKNAATKIK